MYPSTEETEMTNRYQREIGELIRKGRTVYYAHINGHRDLRSRDAARRVESYDRNDIVRALDEAGVLSF